MLRLRFSSFTRCVFRWHNAQARVCVVCVATMIIIALNHTGSLVQAPQSSRCFRRSIIEIRRNFDDGNEVMGGRSLHRDVFIGANLRPQNFNQVRFRSTLFNFIILQMAKQVDIAQRVVSATIVRHSNSKTDSFNTRGLEVRHISNVCAKILGSGCREDKVS